MPRARPYLELQGRLIEQQAFENGIDPEWRDDATHGLPHVDDLTLAADVAASSREHELRLVQNGMHRPQVSNNTALSIASSSEGSDAADTSEESSDESSEVSSSSDSEAENVAQHQSVSVQMQISDTGQVSLSLLLAQPKEGASESEIDTRNAEELGAILDHMETDGDDARAARREAELLGLPSECVPLDVEITKEDVLLPIGQVYAVVGSLVVIQGCGGRTMDEGTVVCLNDTTLIGVVTDVLGPVDAPMYMVNQGKTQAALAQGCEVFRVQRLSTYVQIESLQQAEGRDVLDEDCDEANFSDDDAEAILSSRQIAPSASIPASPSHLPFPIAPKAQHTGRGRGRQPPQTRRPIFPQKPMPVGREQSGTSQAHDPRHGGASQTPSSTPATVSPLPPGQTYTQRSSQQRGRENRGGGRGRRNETYNRPFSRSPGGHGAAQVGSSTILPPTASPSPNLQPQGQWVWVPAQSQTPASLPIANGPPRQRYHGVQPNGQPGPSAWQAPYQQSLHEQMLASSHFNQPRQPTGRRNYQSMQWQQQIPNQPEPAAEFPTSFYPDGIP